jgi:hypothetical protein
MHCFLALCVAGAVLSCRPVSTPTVAVAAATATLTPALATLRLAVDPSGARVYVDQQDKGYTPLTLELPAGWHRVRVQKEGYENWEREFELQPGENLLVDEALRDTAPPVITLGEWPDAAEAGQRICLRAQANDNEMVLSMRVQIDGKPVSQVDGSALDYCWDSAGGEVGLHTVVVEAMDQAGNVSRVLGTVELTSRAALEPSPMPRPTSTAQSALRAYVTAITLQTYPYQPYLRERVDPGYNFKVLWLDRAAYEAISPHPQPRTYKAVVLENRYLQLVLLPELGGRLYKCVLKSSGENIFYQNAVLKPSYWGPLSRDENWWLAAGGMEWALPVQEHGYEWGQFWAYDVEQLADAVSVIVSDKTAEERYQNDRLWAEIRVTLPEDRSYFVVEPRLVNPTSQSVAFQFWINAALTLGSTSASPGTEFIYPTESMVVHSTSDSSLPGERQAMPWPVVNGRDLSWYGNWSNWLGVFVPDVRQGYVGAYNHDTGLGIARVFAPQLAPGLKLFAFGSNFPARGEYTDDGSDYFEMWGGPCKTFWPEDDIVLGPGQSLQWSETWFPFRSIGGLDRASSEAVLKADVQGGEVRLGLAVSAARRAELYLAWNGSDFYQESIGLMPDVPFLVKVPLPDGAALPGELGVRVTDSQGEILLQYMKQVGP